MTIAVDLFAGLGGWTLAATRARCRVVWAANHNARAVAVHRRNHPQTEHACQDLQQADFHRVPRMDLLLGAPACQGHSQCATRGGDGRRGSAPKHDADRSTAWAVVSCAEVHQPPLGLVENVVEFMRWVCYPAWCAALGSLGYSIGEHIVDAADFGVPQHRRRLFLTLTRSRAPLRLKLPQRERVPFGACIDEAAGGWAPVRGKSSGIRARVAAGRSRFGRADFLTQHVTGHPGRALSQPIGTITTACSHWHLVRGDKMRPLSIGELRRGMGFPDDYYLPDSIGLATELLGNAVAPPVGEAVIRAALEAA